MISNTKDLIGAPTGNVPKKSSFDTLNKRHNVPLARTEPINCATMYIGTCTTYSINHNLIVMGYGKQRLLSL